MRLRKILKVKEYSYNHTDRVSPNFTPHEACKLFVPIEKRVMEADKCSCYLKFKVIFIRIRYF